MADSTLQLTLRELRVLFTSLRAWAVIVGVVLVLGLSGPFGTFEALAFPQRLAYWLVVGVTTFAAGSFFSTWGAHELKRRDAPIFVHLPVNAISATLPVVPIVLGINLVMFGSYEVDTITLAQMFIYVFIVAFAVSALFLVFEVSKPETKGGDSGAPKILERLDVTKRGALISLSVQDHYVDVVTVKGRALVLMRLGDAMAETEGTSGVQIHRSHWVALDGVAAIKRQSGRVLVETKSGDILPISRGFMDAAKAAGLIA